MTIRQLFAGGCNFMIYACCIGGLTSIGEAADGPIKNVLMIVSDDLKASVLGCYGDTTCQTPNIDKLASQSMVFDRAYCQGTVCGPSWRSFMFSRYQDKSQTNLGEHFKSHGFYSARVGKIYHMRVPDDIIAGTNGEDVASSCTERFNSSGLEAHTPGDYACLNLNIFTDALPNRQSTQMPHRMFVTVEYDGDGADQPDYSLVPVLKDPNTEVKPGALSFANGVSYRVPNWHLMSYPDGTFELYDMQRDPHELRAWPTIQPTTRSSFSCSPS